MRHSQNMTISLNNVKDFYCQLEKQKYIPNFEEVFDLISRIENFEIQNGLFFAQYVEFGFPETENNIPKLREYKDVLRAIGKEVHALNMGILAKENFKYDFLSLKEKIVTVIGNIEGLYNPTINSSIDTFLYSFPLYTSFPYFETIFYRFNPDIKLEVTYVQKANCRFDFEVKRLEPKICEIVFDVEKKVRSCDLPLKALAKPAPECEIEFKVLKEKQNECKLEVAAFSVLKNCGVSLSAIEEMSSCGVDFQINLEEKTCTIGLRGQQKKICNGIR